MASAQVSLPHNLDAILQDADSKIDKSSDNLTQQLQSGIFLNQKNLKFSLDQIVGVQRFDIYARGLTIARGDDPSCWNWTYDRDSKCNPVEVEVAELVKVSWLDVSKKFPTKYLSPMLRYHVSFEIKKLKENEGLKHVHLKLVVPGQNLIDHTVDLSKLPDDEWKEIQVGEFKICSTTIGDLEVSMYEHDPHLKKGIVVKKLIIWAPIVPAKN